MTSALRNSNIQNPAPRSTQPPARTRRSGGHLRVVEPPSRGRRNALVACAVVVVVFGALLTSALIQSTFVTRQDHIDEVKRETAELTTQLERARAQLAAAQSPENLAAAATRLGMVAPADREWIQSAPTIPNGPVTDPGPATTSDGGSAELAARAPQVTNRGTETE
ncbi:MAG: hypothetical protein KDB02_06435 [Acidimicrobiales bacterium]|nr:hypothetical protein [Acidimicrobiales bacterium]